MEKLDYSTWIYMNKDLIREYKKNNKEEINLFKKEYIEKNKDTNKNFNFTDITKRKKWMHYMVKLYVYNKINKDIINKSKTESIRKSRESHKETNNEKRRQKIICECGSSISKNYKSEHVKSKKHVFALSL